MESSSKYLSIVIPAFNEEHRLPDSLRQIHGYLSSCDFDWEVVVVDDGSTDRTANVAREFSQSHCNIRLLQPPHQGKGGAVRTGMLAATGRYRFLCDADLSMPIEQLDRFLPPNHAGSDIVIGSRGTTAAKRLDEPLRRHLMGRVFNLLVRLIAVPGIHDTQCGFKCFHGHVAQDLFARQTLLGWAFDVEVLFLARQRGFTIVEIPITWQYRDESKVSPLRDAVRMLRDVMRIRWNSLRGRYRAARPAAPFDTLTNHSSPAVE